MGVLLGNLEMHLLPAKSASDVVLLVAHVGWFFSSPSQIKDTFLRTYTEAIQNYNKNDERSHAVDNVQESVSLKLGTKN